MISGIESHALSWVQPKQYKNVTNQNTKNDVYTKNYWEQIESQLCLSAAVLVHNLLLYTVIHYPNFVFCAELI